MIKTEMFIKYLICGLAISLFPCLVFAQEAGGDNRDIAVMASYLFYAVIIYWIVKKLFFKR
jgi:hypothetical protein